MIDKCFDPFIDLKTKTPVVAASVNGTEEELGRGVKCKKEIAVEDVRSLDHKATPKSGRSGEGDILQGQTSEFDPRHI